MRVLKATIITMRQFLLDKKIKDLAQVFSSETLLAYMIFSLAIVIVFFLWTTTITEIKNSERFYAMEEAAIDLGEKLVKTPGTPTNWQNETEEKILSIGLTFANEPRILQKEKILSFIKIMNTSYEERANLLGIGKYNFYFNLTDINGTTIILENISCATGKKPYLPIEMITIKRTALLDEMIVRIILTVWYGEEEEVITNAITTTTAMTTTTMTTTTTTTTAPVTTTTTTTSTTTTTTTKTSTTTSTTVTITTTTLPCDTYYSCEDCTIAGCVWNFRVEGPPSWEEFEWCASSCSQLAHVCKYNLSQC